MARLHLQGIWISRIVFAIITIGLIVLLSTRPLEVADKVASAIAAVLALVALAAPYVAGRKTDDTPRVTVLNGQVRALNTPVFSPDVILGEAEDFTGRRWLFDQVDAFLDAHISGHVIIEAEAGVGKTAFAASLVKAHGWPCHFTRSAGGRGSREALLSLASQIIARCGLASGWAAGGGLAPEAVTPGWFEALLLAASRSMGDQRLVIVIDGLDEAEQVEGALPLGLPRALPDQIYLVMTCRTGFDCPMPTGPVTAPPLRVVTTGTDNLEDMRRHLERRVRIEPIAGRLREARTHPQDFVSVLLDRCSGVWIYLHYVLDEIARGQRSVEDLPALPRSLAGYYQTKLREERESRPDWVQLHGPLLATLAVAGEPLPIDRLAAMAGVTDDAFVRRFCDEYWRAFLTVRGPLYGIYHASLQEFLVGSPFPEAVTRAHLRFVDRLHAEVPCDEAGQRNWSAADGYTRRHLATHAAAAGEAAVLDELLSDVECVLRAEPYSLAPALRGGQPPARVYRVSYGAHQQLDLIGRRRVFAMDAARLGEADLAARASEPDPDGWRPQWATGHRILEALILSIDVGDADVREMACGTVNGQPVAVTRSGWIDEGAGVHVWNLVSGRLLGKLPGGFAVTLTPPLSVHGELVAIVGPNVWNPASGTVTPLPIAASGSFEWAVTATADGGGATVVAANCDQLQAWDLSEIDRPSRSLGRHHMPDSGPLDSVSSLVISVVDGRPAVVAFGGGRGSVRDLGTGAELHEGFGYDTGGTVLGNVKVAAVDHLVVVTAGSWDRNDVEVYDVRTGRPVGCRAAPQQITALTAFAVDGVPYAVAGMHDELWVWSLSTPHEEPRVLPVDLRARALDCTTVGGRPTIVAAGESRVAGSTGFTCQIKLFDAAAVIRLAYQPPLPTIFSTALATVADHPVVLVGTTGGDLHGLDLETGDHRIRMSGGPRGRVHPLLAFSDRAFSATLDGPVQRWNLKSGRAVGNPLTDHPGRVNVFTTAQWNAGTVVVGAGEDEALHFWDPETGRTAREPLLHGHQSLGVGAVASLNPDFLVTGGASDGAIRLHRLVGNKTVGLILDAHWLTVSVLRPVPLEGRLLLVSGGGLDGRVSVWDPDSGKRVSGPMATNRMGVQAVVAAVFAGVPALLTGGFYSTEVGIWSLLTGKRLGGLAMPAPVHGIHFEHDDQLVLQTEHDLIVMTPPAALRPWIGGQ